MSAARRVAHAAETVRARWERQVSTDPQTEAAQALEDTGQLLDPEVAAELAAFRALELGTAEGRVSAKCEDPAHPVWLRGLDDLRGCPWCQVAALLAERRTTNEALDDAVQELRARQAPCPCPPADHPHQVGCPLDGVPDRLTQTYAPVAVPREVEPWLGCLRCRGEKAREYLKNGGLRGGCPACGLDNDGACAACRHRHEVGAVCGTLVATGGMYARRCQCSGPEAPPQALRAALEDPHDGPLAHSYRVPHDLPESCRLDADQVDEVSRSVWFGGGA